jgi:hypothetical protein
MREPERMRENEERKRSRMLGLSPVKGTDTELIANKWKCKLML